MKKILILFAALLIGSSCLFAQSKAGKTDTTKHFALYACSMHPNITSDKPGHCPICGMKLNTSAKEQMKAAVVKNYTCPMHTGIVKHNPGQCPKCGKSLSLLSPKEQMKTQVVKRYTCPMHPEVALDKDGNCPQCGTALVEKKQ